MLQPFRDDFNRRFDPAKYQSLLRELNRKTRTDIQFRVCETPCFFPPSLLEEMAETGLELTRILLGNADYLRAADAAVPEQYRVPNQDAEPNFMTVDFGLARDEAGAIRPKLVEMQAFPSIYGYQDLLARQYVESYGLPEDLRWHFGGLTEESYWNLLGDVILSGHAPENVVLMEVTPERQKTLPDFHVYEDRLGITIVDIAAVRKQGRRLFYERQGRLIPIARIFNRAIVDEMVREQVAPGFDYRDDLEVEWAGHPSWYFRISKFSLPYLDHPAVPRAAFLDDWMAGRREGLPKDPKRLLLKPLYSFAGKGIQFAPTNEDLSSIRPDQRHLYLLQERVDFEPVIATPYGLTQAEIRIMYLRRDGGVLSPVTSLVRLGRGLMMGVDHNRDREWVGGSAALFLGKSF